MRAGLSELELELRDVMLWCFTECKEFVGQPNHGTNQDGRAITTFRMDELFGMLQANHPRVWGELLRAHVPVKISEVFIQDGTANSGPSDSSGTRVPTLGY